MDAENEGSEKRKRGFRRLIRAKAVQSELAKGLSLLLLLALLFLCHCFPPYEGYADYL